MTTRIDTDQQNKLADAGGTSFDGGTLEVRSGAQPASANDAATGTLLASVALPADAFGTAANGVAAKAGTWQATIAASGVPGWGRFTGAGGQAMDISVGHNGSGADMEIAELAGPTDQLVQGGTLTVNTFTLTQPASP